MCGRFTLRTPQNVLVQQFLLESIPDWKPRYNIAPTQPLLCVRREPGETQREAVKLHWGLVPSWADDPKIGNRMINARADGVASKPSFRAAFKRRRCLVLADGYYEWKREGKAKQPYYYRLQNERPFAFAGLWESWHKDAGDPLESVTVITTDANELAAKVHDRMPVILDEADYETWLDVEHCDKDQLQALLVPYDTPLMKAEPVSMHVNNARNDDPQCVEIIDERSS